MATSSPQIIARLPQVLHLANSSIAITAAVPQRPPCCFHRVSFPMVKDVFEQAEFVVSVVIDLNADDDHLMR
jgi:hypothetical protein